MQFFQLSVIHYYKNKEVNILILFEIMLLAIGLAVDASCLCTIIGLVNKPSMSRTLSLALPFSVFQGIMPTIGYFSVGFLPSFLFEYDHWIAFALLEVLGVKMIYDVLTEKEEDEDDTTAIATITAGSLFVQGFSTSIDALAVGVTLHGYSISDMLISVSIVALITYVMCFGAIRIGRAFGTRFNGKAEIIGGIVLVLLGFQLLLKGLIPGL